VGLLSKSGGYGVGWVIVGRGKRIRNDGPGGGGPLYTLSEILNTSDELLEIMTYGGRMPGPIVHFSS
jgi:hypothetical protein